MQYKRTYILLTVSLTIGFLLVVNAKEALGGPPGCPTPPDVVVTNEGELLSALGAASSGDVIGLDGFFGVSADVEVVTDGLTLTCSTPNSGLFALPGVVFEPLEVFAKDVVVEHLILDGSTAPFGAFFAANAENLDFSNNHVKCGPIACALFQGTQAAQIVDNYVGAVGPFPLVTGVHVQATGVPIDGTQIVGNKIITAAPSGFFNFGGLLVRGGSDLTVSDNLVIGPWSNGMTAQAIDNSTIAHNVFEGAAGQGFREGFGIRMIQGSTDNVIRNNIATAAGEGTGIGLGFFDDCGNVLVGNNVQGSFLGYFFGSQSGGNTLIGSNTNLIDLGMSDCDGDSNPDPNVVVGRGLQVLSGENVGLIVSEAVDDLGRDLN